MLVKKLVNYRHYCATQYDAASRFHSLFRPHFDYPEKVAAINKVLLDMDRVPVEYTRRDLDILSIGKLAKVLSDHHDQLPSGLKLILASEREESMVAVGLAKR